MIRQMRISTWSCCLALALSACAQTPAANYDIGFHLRSGKHEVTAFDWDRFLAFADLNFHSR